MVALNAYILYVKQGGQKDRLQFILAVVNQMLEHYMHKQHSVRKGRRSAESCPVRVTTRHFPELLPPSQGKQAPTRHCKVCCSHADSDTGNKI